MQGCEHMGDGRFCGGCIGKSDVPLVPWKISFTIPREEPRYMYERNPWVPNWLWNLVSKPNMSHNLSVSLLRAKRAFEQQLEKGIVSDFPSPLDPGNVSSGVDESAGSEGV